MAVRFVRSWGFTTLAMVAQRFRLTTSARLPREELARRALRGRADLRWLEPTGEWFSLMGERSPLVDAAEKVHAVVGGVQLAELEAALGKRRSFGSAPPNVIRAYVSLLAKRLGDVARPSAPPVLEPAEAHLVDSFRQSGGTSDLRTLVERARGLFTRRIIKQALSVSPLFLRAARGTYRLVGLPVAIGAAVSPQWAAAAY